MSRFRGDDLTL